MPDTVNVQRLQAFGRPQLQQLADVTIDCVEGGASIGFMLPMTREKADTFWRNAAASAARGERDVLVAYDAGTIVGTVTIILAQPENQPHRADIAKMQVHRRARRRGIGEALLVAAQRSARGAGKTLLVLDTASDDAERLYVRQGWQFSGRIPNYAFFPDGRPCATNVFFKSLDAMADATL